MRGHIVRKQSADMLRRMQAMARIQARASATRAYPVETSTTKINLSHSHHHVSVAFFSLELKQLYEFKHWSWNKPFMDGNFSFFAQLPIDLLCTDTIECYKKTYIVLLFRKIFSTLSLIFSLFVHLPAGDCEFKKIWRTIQFCPKWWFYLQGNMALH